MSPPGRDHEDPGAEPGDGVDAWPLPSEQQRTLQAVALGAALGLVLLLLGRRRADLE